MWRGRYHDDQQLLHYKKVPPRRSGMESDGRLHLDTHERRGSEVVLRDRAARGHREEVRYLLKDRRRKDHRFDTGMQKDAGPARDRQHSFAAVGLTILVSSAGGGGAGHRSAIQHHVPRPQLETDGERCGGVVDGLRPAAGATPRTLQMESAGEREGPADRPDATAQHEGDSTKDDRGCCYDTHVGDWDPHTRSTASSWATASKPGPARCAGRRTP